MMRLSEAGASIGVAHQGADAEFNAVGTDSRAVEPGMLFVALKGERFDGHDYVREVLARGAAGAMVEPAWAAANPGLPLLVVNDTRLALGQLAASWRSRFAIPLIGVTGSNGKTTVKEMCAAILCAHFAGTAESVLATQGNLNNDIGLPLTLLKLRATHRAAVIEMGMNHPGEIDYLTRIAVWARRVSRCSTPMTRRPGSGTSCRANAARSVSAWIRRPKCAVATRRMVWEATCCWRLPPES
jgi:UDP-N-acetylmuramoyl-tripeptide--D-alanyl-D-alanine ligase